MIFGPWYDIFLHFTMGYKYSISICCTKLSFSKCNINHLNHLLGDVAQTQHLQNTNCLSWSSIVNICWLGSKLVVKWEDNINIESVLYIHAEWRLKRDYKTQTISIYSKLYFFVNSGEYGNYFTVSTRSVFLTKAVARILYHFKPCSYCISIYCFQVVLR